MKFLASSVNEIVFTWCFKSEKDSSRVGLCNEWAAALHGTHVSIRWGFDLLVKKGGDADSFRRIFCFDEDPLDVGMRKSNITGQLLDGLFNVASIEFILKVNAEIK